MLLQHGTELPGWVPCGGFVMLEPRTTSCMSTSFVQSAMSLFKCSSHVWLGSCGRLYRNAYGVFQRPVAPLQIRRLRPTLSPACFSARPCASARITARHKILCDCVVECCPLRFFLTMHARLVGVECPASFRPCMRGFASQPEVSCPQCIRAACRHAPRTPPHRLRQRSMACKSSRRCLVWQVCISL